MDLQENGKYLIVNGERFAKLSPNDRRDLLAPVKAARRKNLREDLLAGGVKGQEFVNEMDAFDQMAFGEGEFFKYLSSIDGRAEVIAFACRKANEAGRVAEILTNLTIDVDDDFVLAAKLAGVKLKSKESAGDHDEGGRGSGEVPEPRPLAAGS